MKTESVIVSCHSCGAKNRVPRNRILESPVCGKCRHPLDIQQLCRPVDVSDATFDKEVFQSSMPVLVDCWAPWCGPCRAFSPLLEQLALKYCGRLKIVKLNIDDNTGIGSRYRITSVPTLMLVKGGRLIDQIAGAPPLAELERQIARIL